MAYHDDPALLAAWPGTNNEERREHQQNWFDEFGDFYRIKYNQFSQWCREYLRDPAPHVDPQVTPRANADTIWFGNDAFAWTNKKDITVVSVLKGLLMQSGIPETVSNNKDAFDHGRNVLFCSNLRGAPQAPSLLECMTSVFVSLAHRLWPTDTSADKELDDEAALAKHPLPKLLSFMTDSEKLRSDYPNEQKVPLPSLVPRCDFLANFARCC